MNPTGTQDARKTHVAAGPDANTSRRRGMRFGTAATFAICALVLAGGTSSVAHASGLVTRAPHHCVPEGNWAMYGTGFSWVGIPTSLYSAAEAGPGTISYTVSRTVTASVTMSLQATADAGVIFASVSATVGVSVEGSVSNTTTWTYNLSVPGGGLKYYVQNWHKGVQVEIGFDQLNSACQDSWSSISTADIPVSSTSNNTYQYTLVQGSGGPPKFFETW
jgi:hypothetical protein